MSAKIFVDTNVFAYLFDDSEPKKRDAARARLENEHRDGEIVVSTQVLQELYVSLVRGPDAIAEPDVAERAVRDVSQFRLVQVDVPLILAAVTCSRTHQLSFWDALIVRSAVQAGCDSLLTEDLNDGQLIDGVRVVCPF